MFCYFCLLHICTFVYFVFIFNQNVKSSSNVASKTIILSANRSIDIRTPPILFSSNYCSLFYVPYLLFQIIILRRVDHTRYVITKNEYFFLLGRRFNIDQGSPEVYLPHIGYHCYS